MRLTALNVNAVSKEKSNDGTAYGNVGGTLDGFDLVVA